MIDRENFRRLNANYEFPMVKQDVAEVDNSGWIPPITPPGGAQHIIPPVGNPDFSMPITVSVAYQKLKISVVL